MNAPKSRMGAICDDRFIANAIAVVREVIVTTYCDFLTVHVIRFTSALSPRAPVASSPRVASVPSPCSSAACLQNSKMMNTSSTPMPKMRNIPMKLNRPTHVTPTTYTYTNCAAISDEHTAAIPPTVRNSDEVCHHTNANVSAPDPIAHLRSSHSVASPSSRNAHVWRHDAAATTRPPSPLLARHVSITFGPTSCIAHFVAADTFCERSLPRRRNTSRVTSLRSASASDTSDTSRPTVSPKVSDARSRHGIANDAIRRSPARAHRIATAPTRNAARISSPPDADASAPHSPASSGVVGNAASARTSAGVTADASSHAHASMSPPPTTHAFAPSSSPAHAAASQPKDGVDAHKTSPASTSPLSPAAHASRARLSASATVSFPAPPPPLSSKLASDVASATNPSNAPPRPIIRYAVRTSNAENVEWHGPSRPRPARSHTSPAYIASRSIARFSSHVAREMSGANTSPASSDARTKTWSSSAPPPPPSPAVGFISAASSDERGAFGEGIAGAAFRVPAAAAAARSARISARNVAFSPSGGWNSASS
eukprot:31177-Pelagococcus_subviridis.AAC.18